jgi:hypothetical protein
VYPENFFVVWRLLSWKNERVGEVEVKKRERKKERESIDEVTILTLHLRTTSNPKKKIPRQKLGREGMWPPWARKPAQLASSLLSSPGTEAWFFFEYFSRILLFWCLIQPKDTAQLGRENRVAGLGAATFAAGLVTQSIFVH